MLENHRNGQDNSNIVVISEPLTITLTALNRHIISSEDYDQDRNQGGAGERSPPRIIFSPLEKCVGHGLKLLDIVQKIWAPLRKLFAPPCVPKWLRA